MIRSILLLAIVLAAGSGSATAAPALASVEAAAGLAMWVGAGTPERAAPLVATAAMELAMIDVPRTNLYAAFVTETGEKVTTGGSLGLRLRSPSDFRLTAALTAYVAPTRRYGGTVGAGKCLGLWREMSLCGDVEWNVFVAGRDLPPGSALVELHVKFGVAFALF